MVPAGLSRQPAQKRQHRPHAGGGRGEGRRRSEQRLHLFPLAQAQQRHHPGHEGIRMLTDHLHLCRQQGTQLDI